MDGQDLEPSTILWVDLTTVLVAFDRPGKRPTGIPRVALEMALAANETAVPGKSVRYCAWDGALKGFRVVSHAELVEKSAHSMLAAAKSQTKLVGEIAHFIAAVAPGNTGENIDRFRSVQRTLKSTATKVRRSFRRSDAPDHRRGLSFQGGFYNPFSDGDIWINFGCWWHGRNTEALGAIKSAGTDVKTCVLIHDCMPLMYPEYFPIENSRDWRKGLESLKASTDLYLCNSKNTARDVREAILAGGPEAGKVDCMRLGEQFNKTPLEPSEIEDVLSSHDVTRPYVLYTSTIEVRKNHALALRAWRQLLRDRGPDIPLLVFVGNWGWKTRDLKDQLEDSNMLDGHVRVLNGVSDRSLAALYHDAEFTIFPSHYEGWGLPVRESQLHGKVCLAARNSAIVEAGGDLAVYFENDCREDFLRQVCRLLDDPAERTAKEAEIETGFREVSWAEAWADVVGAIRRDTA